MGSIWDEKFKEWREALRNRDESGRLDLDHLKRSKPVYEAPSGLGKKLGESSGAWAERIRSEAKAGNKEAQYEVLRMKGQVEDNRSWTHLDDLGNPKDGYEHDTETEASNDAERKRLYE